MIEIAGYEDFELIGRGGFAAVYRASQVSVGRAVAIKVLSDPAPDADLVRRFSRESRAVGALSWHPHIAAVVDSGTATNGQAFIVFELLTGGSLEDRTEQAPMEWPDAVAAMIEVADAVEAAHREDVLHRDIKPANILLNRLGNAKLADFGIASMQDGAKTETGMLATTVAHAAPELFDGVVASETTDIYAMGSTLHTLITGLPPFIAKADDPIGAIIRRVATEPAPLIDAALAPPMLAALISHTLAKQIELRPRSALAFGKELQHVQRTLGRSVTAMPVGDAEPDPPPGPWRNSLAPPTVTPPPAPNPTGQHVQVQPSPHQPAPYGTPQPAPFATPQPAPFATQPGAYVSGRTDYAQPAAPQPVAPAPYVSGRGFPQQVQAPPKRRRTGRIVGWIAGLAILGGAATAGVIFYPELSETFADPEPIHITAGGARVIDRTFVDTTTIAEFPGENATDGDVGTYWGLRASGDLDIVGTTYVLKFDDEVRVTQVGISNGASTDLGRISQLAWATSISEFNSGAASVVRQEVPDQRGEHQVPFGTRTDQIALLITGVHDDEAPDAGIAEILIEVE